MHNIKPFLPELFTEPGSLLYIGARIDAHSWLEELYKAGNQITVLEVWQDNLDKLMNDWRIENLVLGDARNIVDLFVGNFNYIFWWHGPEHLEQNDILSTLQNLESKTNKLIALASPWGWYPQGEYKGNPYEKHQSTLYPKFFELLGYKVETDGVADKAGSQVVAWKKLV
jgi:hypothetical protein